MVGSHGSNPRKGLAKRLVAVFALLALLGTACGGADDTATTATASAAASDVEYGSWGASEDSDTGSPAEPAAASADTTPAAPAAKKSGAPSLGSISEPSELTDEGAVPAAPVQTAEVLAYAIQASEELSYSFEQGMSMQMSMMGLELDIAPTEAFVTGEVSGNDSRVLVDLGSFMASMFESMGMNLADPLFAGLFGDLEDMTMEVWVVDTTMVIDMSGLAGSIAGLDPAAASELSMFADGPVSIDLAAIDVLGGTDAAALVQQFGQGAQVTDPAALVDALRAVDAVTESGSSTVGETPVTVYSANLSMSDYYDALGMDLTDQIGSMDEFGIDPGSAEGELIESMLPALEDLTVDMSIMLDGDGLVRRIETHMDMGEMMTAMFSGDPEMSSIVGDIDVVVDTWQNFDDYGTDIVITAPDAADRTSELAGLIDA